MLKVPEKCPFCDRDLKDGKSQNPGEPLKDAVLYACGLILQPKDSEEMIAKGCEFISKYGALTSTGENKWYVI
ncbi:MAG: hypothetical protein KAS32_12715 [Candidatus Peribacteraceae bacterium]|nr:hypothetical protein [Candidatus Peribacteraceae bacterium]